MNAFKRVIRLIWGRSVKRQLVLGVAFVHMVLMTIFVYDLVHRQKEFLVERARLRTVFQAELLAKAGLYPVLTQDSAALIEILAPVSKDKTIIYGMITDPDGRVLGHTEATRAGTFLSKTGVESVFSSRSSQSVLFHEDSRSLVAAAPIRVRDRTAGWAFVARDLASDQAHLQYVTQAGLIYTGVAILIGTLFAVALSRAITRPLNDLVKGAQRLSENKLDEPVPVTSENEVGDVTKAFNEAMAKLSAKTAALDQINRELSAAVEVRDEFLSIASHELKTPLTSMRLQLELARKILQQSVQDPQVMERFEHGFDVSSRQITRLTDLVEDLLDVARIQAGKLVFRFEPLNLSRLISEVLERVMPQLLAAKCEVRLNLDAAIEAKWDASRIEQVIVNLLSNAAKYAPGSVVTVKTERLNDRVKIEVADTGGGIQIDRVSKIFDRFERATSSRNISGLGLGLYLVKQIVEGHRGTIGVETGQNIGARFTVILPVDPESISMSESKVVLLKKGSQIG